MAVVATLSFREARDCVIAKVAGAGKPPVEEIGLDEADGRVLAEEVAADRDYPAVARSLRDGYAVRSADLPGAFEVIGEVRAGGIFERPVGPGEALEIMTGAPVPEGADQVVMLEHTRREDGRMTTDRGPNRGEWVNPKGSEAKAGQAVLAAGARLDYSSIAMLATVGKIRVKAYRRPRVAILATGDELVEAGAVPREYQIRNSNAVSLAAQARRAGGIPEILPAAPDEREATRRLLERGLRADLLLISGGVSAGKYDVVEQALEELEAEFFFDGTLIQPGKPTVFGRARGTFFFGLPGNPVSTMVTFNIFARAALESLGGQSEVALPVFPSRLTGPFRHKTGLTRFLPARLSPDGGELTPIKWQGSSDVAAAARANAFLVADPERESWEAGEWMPAMPK
ncbi:MAG: molybdopterin molybdotransferase MoeA [Bryobacteraceae bacterium]|nr:molybdopterin molybdotransferase MoeA [Bryobacteraceae bacterium]